MADAAKELRKLARWFLRVQQKIDFEMNPLEWAAYQICADEARRRARKLEGKHG